MALEVIDYAVLAIVAVFPLAAIPAARQAMRINIAEAWILFVVLMLTGLAAGADFLSHHVNDDIAIILWKLAQFTVITLFFVIAIYAMLLQYYRLPLRLTIPLVLLYLLGAAILWLAPDTTETSSDTVSAMWVVDTSIGDITLISDTVNLVGDITQLYASLIAFTVFVNIYIKTTSKAARRATTGQVVAFGLLFASGVWETLESTIGVQDVPTSYLLALAIIIIASVYLYRPQYILLSPVYVRNLLVVTEHGGIPLFKIRFKQEESRVDSVLVGGAMSAIDSLMRTISGTNADMTRSALEQIILRDRVLMVHNEGGLLFMTTVSRPTRILRSALSKFANDYVARVGHLIEAGRLDRLEPFQQFELVQTTFPFMDPESLIPWDEEWEESF